MSTKVLVSYDLTKEELHRASLIWRREYSWTGRAWYGTFFFRGMFWLFLAMVVCDVWQSWISQSLEGHLVYLILFPLILWEWLNRWSSKNLDWNHPLRLTISSDRWLIESHTSRIEFLWSPVKSIVRVSEGFVVDFHDRSFRWLPIHGFESEAAIETFVRMVEPHDVKYDDRRRAG